MGDKMKIAMLILGVIGALIGLGGGLVTIVSGFGATAISVAADNTSYANAGAFVFWSGVLAIGINVLALAFSVTGGVAKRRATILTFGLATLISGVLGIYLYNWVSGFLIALAGFLGMLGAKDGIEPQTSIKQSPLFYITAVFMLVLCGLSVLVKNGREVIESPNNAVAVSENNVTTDPASSAPVAKTSTSKPVLPFVGKRYFNFYGGSGTGRRISISPDGAVVLEALGSEQSSVEYQGPFSNPLRTGGDSALLFKDSKVYPMTGDKIDTGCSMQPDANENTPCESELIEE